MTNQSVVRRREFLRIAGVVAGGVALSACQPATPSAPSAAPTSGPSASAPAAPANAAAPTAPAAKKGAGTTLQFLGAQPPALFNDVLAGFKQENPEIEVAYSSVPFDELNAAVQSRIGSKDSSIDVFMPDEPRVPAQAARGFLEPVENMRPQIEAAVFKEAVEAVSWNGKIYAFPLWTSTQFLYYNKELLQAANVTPPSSDPAQRITWEELLDSAKKAQTAKAKWGFTFQQVDRYYQLQVLPESLGAGSGLTGDTLLTPAITNDGWTKAFTWYGALFADNLSPRGIPPEQTPNLFSSGQVAYLVATPANVGAFVAAQGLQFGIAPHPYFAGGKAVTPTDSWALGVNPYGKNKEAALKLMNYMTLDPKGATLSSSLQANPTPNKVAFEEYLKRITKQVGASASDIIRYELGNTTIHRPRSIGYVDFEEVMNRAFSDIRNGAQAGPRLEQASGELTGAFAKYRS